MGKIYPLNGVNFETIFCQTFPFLPQENMATLKIILDVNYMDINVAPISMFLVDLNQFYGVIIKHIQIMKKTTSHDLPQGSNRFTNESYHNTLPKPQSFTFFLGNNDNFNGMGCH